MRKNEYICDLCMVQSGCVKPATIDLLHTCIACRIDLEKAAHFSITVPLKAVGKERARVVTTKKGKRRSYTPERTVAFEADFKMAVVMDMPAKPWSGPVRMETTFRIPHDKAKGPVIARPDLDNYEKAVMDSLQKLAYNDDSQVWRATSQKIYAREPSIEMTLYFDDITWCRVKNWKAGRVKNWKAGT